MIGRRRRVFHFATFSGNTCESPSSFVEILEFLDFILRKTLRETLRRLGFFLAQADSPVLWELNVSFNQQDSVRLLWFFLPDAAFSFEELLLNDDWQRLAVSLHRQRC